MIADFSHCQLGCCSATLLPSKSYLVNQFFDVDRSGTGFALNTAWLGGIETMNISLKRTFWIFFALLWVGGFAIAKPTWLTEFPYGNLNGFSTDLKLLPNGNVIAASGSIVNHGPIVLNVSLNDPQSGKLLRALQVPFSVDEVDVVDMAVNSSGETYILSTLYNFFGGTPAHQAYLTKLDSGLHILWNRRVSSNSEAYALEMDSKQNVVVGLGDYTISKYNLDGKLIWSTSLNNPVLIARAMKIDSANNIYVLGNNEVSSSSYKLDVAMFNSSGTLIWEVTMGGISDWVKQDTSAITINGGIFVATPIDTPVSGILVAKLNSAGNILWSTVLPPYGSTYWVGGIEFSSDIILWEDVVYVAFQSDSNAVAIKLDATYGFQYWRMSNPGYLAQQANYAPNEGGKADQCGTFLIGARDANSNGGLLSFDHYGNPTFDSAGYGMDPPGGLELDTSNNIYLGGEGPTKFNLTTMKFPARVCH